MISTHARNLLLSWMLTAGAATRPTAWYVSLHVADPGTTGADEVVVGTDADYVRKAVTFDTPAAGETDNTGAVTFTADVAADTYVVTHIGIWDASTGGNFLLGGELAVPETVEASDALVLGIGRIVAALT